MKREPMQFKSIKEVDKFIEKAGMLGLHYFEDMYAGIAYVYSAHKEEKQFVKEFNAAIKDMFKLVSQ